MEGKSSSAGVPGKPACRRAALRWNKATECLECLILGPGRPGLREPEASESQSQPESGSRSSLAVEHGNFLRQLGRITVLTAQVRRKTIQATWSERCLERRTCQLFSLAME